MEVEPFELDHFRDLVLQPYQKAWQAMLASEDWTHLGKAGEAWTGLVDGRPVACCGVLDRGGGRGDAWALLAGDIGPTLLPLTRAILRGLKLGRWRRIEAITAANFKPARRWVRMLGFEFESTARAYFEDGADAERWARIF